MMTLHHYNEIDSTNAEALRLAAAGAAHGTVVLADRQTGGRGRRGRVWQSLAGNLHWSIILRLGECGPPAGTLPLVAGLALAELVEGLAAGAAVIQVKWPNDLLVNGRKAGGLLIEASGSAYVLGIGVNLVAAPPGPTHWPATSLLAEGIATEAPRAFAGALVDRLQVRLADWHRDGFAALRHAYRARLAGLGEVVTLRPSDDNGTAQHGRFRDIDDNGHLILETDQGIATVSVGDLLPPRERG